jgi:6,7-dimethyl-8-ribityllumazine synthase
MVQTLEGNLLASDLRVAVIVSRWNSFITDRLVEGALDAFVRHGGAAAAVTVVKVPGAFEIPLAATKAAKSGRFDAIVCLGTVIRGSTPHFDYIAAEVTKGTASTAMETGLPVAFGVLTTETIEQAVERAGTKMGNKGAEAMLAAIEMANLYRQL